MQRLISYRQADRAEYLAQYILSSFSIAVPVPRQEDVGTDFHCTLLKRDGYTLRPTVPFNIQIKSAGEGVIKNGIRFGGITEGGSWRRHELEILCQTDTPFLVGLVNLKAQSLDLFSTITRYFVLSNWQGTGAPREVALIPYEPAGEEHLGAGAQEDLDPQANMPLKLWKLPIGQPIVSISIEESEDPRRCEEIKDLLTPYLRIDQENAVCFRIGLGYFLWPLIVRPGQPLRELGIALATPDASSPNVQSQLKVLCRLTASLLRSYQMSGMKTEILTWDPVTRQLPFASESTLVQGWLKEALTYARS